MVTIYPGEWKTRWNEYFSGNCNEDPILFVLTGLPGSGKSTWAQLEANTAPTEYTIVSTDYFLEQSARDSGKDYEWAFVHCFKDAKRRAMAQVRNATKERKNIIWDQTNMTAKSRRRALANVGRGYHKIVIGFEVADMELRKRLAARRTITGKFIPPEVIKNFQNVFEPPSLDEGFEKMFCNSGPEYDTTIQKMLGERTHADV